MVIMHKILLLNGPNLNLLGTREPAIYGTQTLAELEAMLKKLGDTLGIQVLCQQSNSEAELIEWVHHARQQAIDFMIVNPAAFTHTSIALRDAMAAVNIPFIEVHLSNIYAREPFRQHSYFSDLALAVISGLGIKGYEHALHAAHDFLVQHQH